MDKLINELFNNPAKIDALNLEECLKSLIFINKLGKIEAKLKEKIVGLTDENFFEREVDNSIFTMKISRISGGTSYSNKNIVDTEKVLTYAKENNIKVPMKIDEDKLKCCQWFQQNHKDFMIKENCKSKTVPAQVRFKIELKESE